MAQEKVILYNLLDQEKGQIMKTIFEQLGVDVIRIDHKDLNQSVGYLFGLDGFSKEKKDYQKIRNEEMLVFHGFSTEQMELVLDVFQGAQIPFIPYKAMTTSKNIELPFHQFLDRVIEEYESRLLHGHQS
ncbi:MAG: DUF3783 domain-containing protein [Faecalibacillus sp.]